MRSNGIIVGEVIAVRPHPNGQRIFLADVHLGEMGKVQIVFGGELPLVGGERVAVAPPGARLHTGVRLRRSRFRGEVSYGMLCSTDELGWTKNGPDEVAVLPAHFAVGQSLDDVRPRIVFLGVGASDIGRSWAPHDVKRHLESSGFATSFRRYSEAGVRDLVHECTTDYLLVWPTSYDIDSPGSGWIVDRLAHAGVPHIGSSTQLLAASSKIRLSRALHELGLPTPASWVVPQALVDDYAQLNEKAHTIIDSSRGNALLVKCEYSSDSRGVTLVRSAEDLSAAIKRQLEDFGQDLLVQEYVRHREFTCAVIGRGADIAVSSLEIVLPEDHAILDQHVKQTYEDLKLFAVDDPDLADRLREQVTRLWNGLGGGEYARVDIVQDKQGQLYVIDVNLQPCLDQAPPLDSFFPIAFKENNSLRYGETIDAIVTAALVREGMQVPASLAAVPPVG